MLNLLKGVVLGACEVIIITIILILPLPDMLKILLIIAATGGIILGAVSGGLIAIASSGAKTAIYAAMAIMVASPVAYGGAWAMGMTSICGDGRCDLSECQTGCTADCSAATCADNICQIVIGENCGNSLDCACPADYACNLGKNGTDIKGCYVIGCGDGSCDPPETNITCCTDCGCGLGYTCVNNLCQTQCGDTYCVGDETQISCCTDCGCATGYSCQNNACILESLALTVSGFQLSGEYSATTLKTNPTLHYPIIASGSDHSLMIVTIRNNGQTKASNTQVGVKVGDYSDWLYKNVGDLLPSDSEILQFNPVFNDNIWQVSEDEMAQVNIKISYDDVQGTSHTNYFSETMKIISREWMNWQYPGFIAGWITPNDDMIRTITTAATTGLAPGYNDNDILPAAKRIWAYLNGTYSSPPGYSISYVSDPRGMEFVQFPATTLRNQAGDCEDLAVLFATALESVGIRTLIVVIEGHAYMIFCASATSCGNVHPVETTMITGSFEAANNQGKWEYQNQPILAQIDTYSPYILPPDDM